MSSSTPPLTLDQAENNDQKQTWIRFEDEKAPPTLQVENFAHSLSDLRSSSDTDLETRHRSSSPPSTLALGSGRTSPRSVILPPPPLTLPVRKAETTPTRNSCPPVVAQDNGHGNMETISLAEPPRTVQGFNNGDIVVTLLPVNQDCPWVTKAQFKPELVPEELMAQGLTLTVEDYVLTMQVLVNDVRFNIYNVCYKRVLIVWILLGFLILLSLLFSGVRGLALFGGGIVWLIVNALGIFICMWIKIKLYRMLEQCMAGINALLYKHRILVGLDDRGKISCHKVNLIFVYFDVSYCIKYLKDMLENDEKSTQEAAANDAKNAQNSINQSRMDIDTSDIIITGSNSTRLSQKEKYAEKLFLRYSQRWVKEFVRRRLDLRLPLHPDGTTETGPPAPPRHCPHARCPCQFIEEHLRFKPLTRCNIRDLFS